MSRQQFSDEFGFSVRTLEKWERGERIPKGPTRAYLTVIAQNPAAVVEALKSVIITRADSTLKCNSIIIQ